MVTLFCAALMAAVAAVILQPQVIWSVATGGALADYTRLGPAEAFRGTMLSIYSSTRIDTLNPELNELVSTKGITGMLNTVYLIIAASVRNPIHVTDCALAGADIATVPYNVIVQMTKHPLTDAGIEKFQADYKAVFGE